MKTYTCLIFTLFTLSLSAQEFTEMEVQMDTAPGFLEASLIEPLNISSSIVLIIPGSGPTDRNGNSAMGLNNNSLKMVAEELAKAGISSLRIDKRGIAGSNSAMISEKDLVLETFVDDIKSWIDLAVDSLSYSEVIIMGHSQGSLVGMLAAIDNPKVNGFISLAGVAESIDETILKQIKTQAPVLVDETEVIIDSLKMGLEVTNVFPMLMSVFRPSIQPFLISYMQYDPVEIISQLAIPSLIINGTNDIQVASDNAVRLDSAASNSNLKIIEGMNHVLKDAPKDLAANAATYNQPELPLADELMDTIIDFIKNLN